MVSSSFLFSIVSARSCKKIPIILVGVKLKPLIDTAHRKSSTPIRAVRLDSGIAVESDRNTNVESLVRSADDAMYVAKVAGKARVHISRIDAQM